MSKLELPAAAGRWERHTSRQDRGAGLRRWSLFLEEHPEYVRRVVHLKSGNRRYTAACVRLEGPPRSGSPRPLSQGKLGMAAPLTERFAARPLAERVRFSLVSVKTRKQSVGPRLRARCLAGYAYRVRQVSIFPRLPGIARGGTTLVISQLRYLDGRSGGQAQRAGELRGGHVVLAQPRSLIRPAWITSTTNFNSFIAPERLRVAGFHRMLPETQAKITNCDRWACIAVNVTQPDYRMLDSAICIVATSRGNCTHRNSYPAGPGRYLRTVGTGPANAVSFRVSTRQCRDWCSDCTDPDELRSPANYCSIHPQARHHLHADTKAGGYLGYPDTPETLPRRRITLGSVENREQVSKIITGPIEVMVATIAFGMESDKPNLRTIIHTALPGSVEGYIKRSDEQGAMKRRAIANALRRSMRTISSSRRDYPDVAVLDSSGRSRTGPQAKTALRKRLRMKSATSSTKLSKNWIHRAAVMDFAENVSAVSPSGGSRTWLTGSRSGRRST